MKHRFASVATLAAFLLATPAWAGSPTEEIRGFFVTASKILDDPATDGKPDDRLRAIFGAVRGIFDFRGTARFTLGPAWTARTATEHEEFVRLFADLIERSFVFGIAARIQLGEGVKVSYLEESVAGDDATVRTTIENRQGFDLPFTYRMVERGQGWAIRDVVIDGVSVAANYRAQFARILQGSSYADLIRQMRARVLTPQGEPELGATPAGEVAPAVPPKPAAAAPASDPPRLAVRIDPPRAPVAMPAPDLRVPEPAPATRPAARLPEEPIPLAQPEPEATARPWSTARERLAEDEAVALVSVRERPASPDPPAAAPAPELARSRPKAAPDARGISYWVQVGAFKDPEGARRLAADLQEQAPAKWPVVVDRSSATATLTRVRFGPFARRADASAHLRALEARGYRAFMAPERD